MSSASVNAESEFCYWLLIFYIINFSYPPINPHFFESCDYFGREEEERTYSFPFSVFFFKSPATLSDSRDVLPI